jgi:hypothetical protein
LSNESIFDDDASFDEFKALFIKFSSYFVGVIVSIEEVELLGELNASSALEFKSSKLGEVKIDLPLISSNSILLEKGELFMDPVSKFVLVGVGLLSEEFPGLFDPPGLLENNHSNKELVPVLISSQ